MKRIRILFVFFIFSHQVFSQCSGLNISVTGQDVTCNNFSNGQINYSVSGGSGNFTIALAIDSNLVFFDNNSSGSFINIWGGEYVAIVQDNISGCIDSTSIIIVEPDQLSIEFDTLTAVSCFGLCDGTLAPIISGGTQPYNILWNDPMNQTTQIATGLCFGHHTLSVTDNNGCNTIGGQTVEQPYQLSNYFSINNADCQNCNGSINSNPFGGFPPYTYSWSGGLPTQQNPSNVCPGEYIMTMADSNGCVLIDTAQIFEIGDINITPISSVGSACTFCNGEVIFEASGSNPPFIYEIPNYPNSTNGNISNLCEGNYTLTVSDSLGCVQFYNFGIGYESINGLNLTYVVSNETDYAFQDGIIDLNLNNYSGVLTYDWSNGATSEDVYSLTQGPYNVTIYDSLGNCNTESFQVNCLNGGGQIFGKIVNEINTDCNLDSTDLGLNGRYVSASNGIDQIYGYTNYIGEYSMILPAGNWTIQPSNTLFLNSSCGLYPSLSVSPGSTYLDLDFFYDIPPHHNANVSVYTTGIVPGFTGSYQIYLGNNGNLISDGTLCMVLPNELIFNSGLTTGESISGDTICFTFTQLNPSESQYFTVYFDAPTTLPLGTNINTCTEVAISNGTDSDLSDNMQCNSRLVTGSFDPNDKTVSPAGENASGDVLVAEEEFTYLVRFQNTGTGPAVNITITDTLTSMLNPLSFEMLNASHPYTVEFINGNIIKWRFENIMLPDSGSNEPASHGHVQFRLNTQNTPVIGQVIENRANIYFDFNEPVITNTAINTFVAPNSVEELSNGIFSIYPNPAENVLYVQSENGNASYTIYDVSGKVFSTTNTTSSNSSLDIISLSSGIYFIQCISGEEVSTIKFIKR